LTGSTEAAQFDNHGHEDSPRVVRVA